MKHLAIVCALGMALAGCAAPPPRPFPASGALQDKPLGNTFYVSPAGSDGSFVGAFNAGE